MTNDEISKWLMNLKDNIGKTQYQPLWHYAEALGMAIKALTAQPEKTQLSEEDATSDCISRQAAIDAILDVTGNSSVRELYEHVQEHGLSDMWSGGVSAAIDIIIAVPPVQPEPHWIPCSERLPKKNGFYLCTTKDYITVLEFIEGNPHYHEEPSFVSDVLGKCNSYVVAWMPLPEPYKGVGA